MKYRLTHTAPLVHSIENMEYVIYKYELHQDKPETQVTIPANAKVLTAQEQDHSRLIIWVKLDPNEPKVKRRFLVVPTGMKFSPDETELVYVGTVQRGDGIVLHVFEVVKK